MPRPVTPVDDLMGILPDTSIQEVYLPLERLFVTGGLCACVSLLSGLLLAYGSHMYFCNPDKIVRKRFLPVVLIALVCTILAGVSAWAILYTGTRMLSPNVCA